jgi:XTP/dITP diphosphohydrolase
MRGVPGDRRSAEFVCVLVVCGPGGTERHFEGRCAGRLADEPRGRGGFGYDPLFVPEGFESTFAEMSAGEKNRISHRARAWSQCVGWLADRV